MKQAEPIIQRGSAKKTLPKILENPQKKTPAPELPLQQSVEKV